MLAPPQEHRHAFFLSDLFDTLSPSLALCVSLAEVTSQEPICVRDDYD